jgi:hypothetical protein
MLLNKFSCSNFQLVELIVPAGSPNQKISFQDQPLLRDKAIYCVQWIQGIATSPSGNPVQLASANVFLTLATDNGNEFIQDQPFPENSPINNLGSYVNFNGSVIFAPRKVVFPKSYITYSVSSPLLIQYSILFGVYYK